MTIILKEKSTEPDMGAYPDHAKSSRSSKHRDAAWRLELLNALHTKSLLTDEEFEAKSGKIFATT
jgi:hypothetical protein